MRMRVYSRYLFNRVVIVEAGFPIIVYFPKYQFDDKNVENYQQVDSSYSGLFPDCGKSNKYAQVGFTK